MDMNKTNSSIDENEESLVGEVLSDDEVREKKQAIAKWQHSPVGFGSYITKRPDPADKVLSAQKWAKGSLYAHV